MDLILACAYYLILPAILVLLCQRFTWLDKIGVVVLSFLSGISFTSLGLPDFFMSPGIRSSMQSNLSEVSIALALPLLVFSIDVRASLSIAGNTMKSMGMALIAVIVSSICGAWLFSGYLADTWQVAGMSVGAYTGGGPNMAAIKTAIGAEENLFTTMITYDILLSAFYLVFVMTLAKPFFRLFLRPFSHNNESLQDHHKEKFAHLADETANSYKILAHPSHILKSLTALILSGFVVALAVGFSSMFPGSMASAVTIIAITSLGVLASFIPKVRSIPTSFQLGMYLILVFCFTTGNMTDTSIVTSLNVDLFCYISFILVGSLLIQALLCKLFKIDTDTFLITSSAAIMSVPFIPVIAGALKNKEIIIPGFAAAIVGYIAGNYLGVAVAYFLHWQLG